MRLSSIRDRSCDVAELAGRAGRTVPIGPLQVVVAQFLGVAVDQPQRPGRRQQRRDGNQAKWRRRIFGAEHFSGPLEIPKSDRIEAGIDQKRVAGLCVRYTTHLLPHVPTRQGRPIRCLSLWSGRALHATPSTNWRSMWIQGAPSHLDHPTCAHLPYTWCPPAFCHR